MAFFRKTADYLQDRIETQFICYEQAMALNAKRLARYKALISGAEEMAHLLLGQ